MSGGRFGYLDSSLKSEIFGWSNSLKNVFEDKEISELVFDVLDLIHEYDWYISGDNCRETYLLAKSQFKNKWLDNKGVRVQRIVDEAIAQLKTELYETFSLEVLTDAHD